MSESAATVVVDKHAGWRVIHVAPFSLTALPMMVLFGGLALFTLGAAVAGPWVKETPGTMATLLVACVCALLALYLFTFSFFVAFDDGHVARGRFA